MGRTAQLRLSPLRSTLVLVVSLLLVAFAADAQTPTVLRDPLNGKVIGLKPIVVVANPKLAQPSAVVSTTQAKSISDSFIATYKDVIGLSNPATQLTALPGETDDRGISHFRYYQTQLKLGILGAEVIVHVDPTGQVTLATTKVARNLPTNTLTKVSSSSAKQLAIQKATTEVSKKVKLAAKSAKLLIVPLDILNNTATPNSRLAWEVKVDDSNAGGRVFSKNYYVDGISGQIIFATSNIAGLDSRVMADMVNDQLVGGGASVTTVTMDRSVYDCGSPNSTCQLDQYDAGTNYTYGRSESAPARGPSPQAGYVGSTNVDSMHSILGSMHSFVSSSFGLDGANGLGGTGVAPAVPVTSTLGYVHFDSQQSSSICINGTRAQFAPSTGELDFCKGEVGTDVVGHEYSHAILFHNFKDNSGISIGPVYYGQAGALNEAFADIMGEALENAVNGTNDWLMGAGTAHGAYRNLATPSATQYATNSPYPTRYYSPTMYCTESADNNGVHVNSTIIGHAFYRMAVGGDEIGCDISPIGIEAAKQIFYRAWHNYFSRTVTFAEAYNAIPQACADLYPAATCDQVTKALQAAEINQPGYCSGQTEPGPTCAVRHVSNAYTARPTFFFDDQWSPQILFAPTEILRVIGWGNAPNQNIKLYFKVKPLTTQANYWDLSLGTYTQVVVTTTGPNGEVDVTFPNIQQFSPARPDNQIYIDGNNDGLWEPWADTVLPFQIKQVVNNDGLCYQGELYTTSETCMSAPIDCACPGAGYHCQDISSGMLPGPYYYCVYNP